MASEPTHYAIPPTEPGENKTITITLYCPALQLHTESSVTRGSSAIIEEDQCNRCLLIKLPHVHAAQASFWQHSFGLSTCGQHGLLHEATVTTQLCGGCFISM